MIFYCPACWREVPELIHVCPYCKVDVERLTLEQDYAQKLIAALEHPEPTTPVRVAWILGVRKETRAIPPIASGDGLATGGHPIRCPARGREGPYEGAACHGAHSGDDG